jgi:hypothetical protein
MADTVVLTGSPSPSQHCRCSMHQGLRGCTPPRRLEDPSRPAVAFGRPPASSWQRFCGRPADSDEGEYVELYGQRNTAAAGEGDEVYDYNTPTWTRQVQHFDQAAAVARHSSAGGHLDLSVVPAEQRYSPTTGGLRRVSPDHAAAAANAAVAYGGGYSADGPRTNSDSHRTSSSVSRGLQAEQARVVHHISQQQSSGQSLETYTRVTVPPVDDAAAAHRVPAAAANAAFRHISYSSSQGVVYAPAVSGGSPTFTLHMAPTSSRSHLVDLALQPGETMYFAAHNGRQATGHGEWQRYG